MKHNIKIAVIGGTGKSGKYLVKQLIHQGYHIKLLVRNPDHYSFNDPLIEIVKGNVTNYNAVHSLLEECHAVISTLGLGIPASDLDIFSQSTLHVIKAMHALHIKRYIVTTGLNVDTPIDNKGQQTAYGTKWMKENFPASTVDKQKEYEILLESTIDWTLVRLPSIEQTDEVCPIQISLQDCQGSKISSTSLADFLIEQLSDEKYVKQSPFIANR